MSRKIKSKKWNPPRKSNPRFVWAIGSIYEEFPDVPEFLTASSSATLWDRQEQKAVMVIDSNYANAICLQLTKQDEHPFSLTEDWINKLSNRALASECIKPTDKKRFWGIFR